MIIADLLRAVLVFLIPFLVPSSIVWLYVIVILTSAIGQFFDPAYESVLPEVAPDEELAAANSLMAISTFGSTAIGFAASGLIAANYPIALCLLPGCHLIPYLSRLYPVPASAKAGDHRSNFGGSGFH